MQATNVKSLIARYEQLTQPSTPTQSRSTSTVNFSGRQSAVLAKTGDTLSCEHLSEKVVAQAQKVDATATPQLAQTPTLESKESILSFIELATPLDLEQIEAESFIDQFKSAEPLDVDNSNFISSQDMIADASPLNVEQDSPFQTPLLVNAKKTETAFQDQVRETRVQSNPEPISQASSSLGNILPSRRRALSADSYFLSNLHDQLTTLSGSKKLRLNADNQTIDTKQRSRGSSFLAGRSQATQELFTRTFDEMHLLLDSGKTSIVKDGQTLSLATLLKELGHSSWGKAVIKGNKEIRQGYQQLLLKAEYQNAKQILGPRMAYSLEDFTAIKQYLAQHRGEFKGKTQVIEGENLGIKGRLLIDGQSMQAFAFSDEKTYQLGEGKSRIVWTGVDVTTGDPVAIAKDLGDIDARDKELRILKQFKDNSSFVGLKGTFEDNETFFSVYEYCDGGECAHHLKNLNRYQQDAMARGILTGVQALHADNLAHGDLKLANFLLKDGNAKITDFGEVVENALEAKQMIKSERREVGEMLYQIYINPDDLTIEDEKEVKIRQLKSLADISNKIDLELNRRGLALDDRMKNIRNLIVDLLKPIDNGRISLEEASLRFNRKILNLNTQAST